MLNVKTSLLLVILLVSLEGAECPIPEDQRSQVLSGNHPLTLDAVTIKSEDSNNQG